MRYTITTEICDICGKEFNGAQINIHGSYDYMHHTNFSNNIGVMFARTKNLSGDERAYAIVKEFFRNDNDKIGKADAIEFLECFLYYKHPNKELLQNVFTKIQEKIDMMK